MTTKKFARGALPAATALLLAACASTAPIDPRGASIQRTANGVAHISAPDFETLAYGAAYARAQDNFCLTAQQLVTVRGERSRWFGGTATARLGLRVLPNEQIDLFIAAHMDDAALARGWAGQSADSQALSRGYVAGYNRYLADNAGKLPAACNGQPWVKPMTVAEHRRLLEELTVLAASVGLADAVVAARPPEVKAASLAHPVDLADAAAALREMGLLDSPIGSNAWAFGRDTTGTGHGLLLGNPHFPWAGVTRFWQLHLTVPGQYDAMGVGIGDLPMVLLGFNKDVAWTQTVSTGKRFTLHELTLVAGDPTSYLIDGQPEKMKSRSLSIMVKGADGLMAMKEQTVWSTRWGPLVVLPRAGLNWTAKNAYALQDANAGNARNSDTLIGFGRARNVDDMRKAMANLGTPIANTLAVDRDGNAMYADVSAVPDVDAAQVARCAPSAPAAALRGPAGIIVLDGSKSSCDWKRDPASPVPGLTPIERMAVAVRTDWVHNSNDSFFYTHPAQRWEGISPMVGDDFVRRSRTRAGLIEVPELVARGPVTMKAAQEQLFANRNTMAQMVLPDLLKACPAAPNADATEGCKVLAVWDRTNNLDARGAHLFREFWRSAMLVPGVYRLPFDKAQPVATPAGLKMDDAATAAKVWDALVGAVKKVRDAGFKLDSPLGSVQWPLITEQPIAIHGGEEFEGVLNNVGNQYAPGISAKGLRIDYGSSYIQTVTFDERGPLAQAILTYGQSTDPASRHATDQLRLYSLKQWPTLPFHAEDVAKARVGEVLNLSMP